MTHLLETAIYKRRRRTKGMSQYALANKVGVTRNCIYLMECHDHMPKAETIFDIIMALGFSDEERKAFAEKYMDAYYKDKVVQKELGKE
jgi:DNA-binding XRE family transcriptional regulator